jgi:hypothetical protein
MLLDKDAFSSGQVLSKLWLAEELEKVVIGNNLPQPLRILCFGGWYGVVNFMLRSRSNVNIEKFKSVDLDPIACENADLFNEAWVWQSWQFKAICDDANTFSYSPLEFNTVINTSIEHIEGHQWFDRIPMNALVVLQSNNMAHDDHCHNHSSLDDFRKEFDISHVLFSGEKLFEYPSWSFKRFMIIGIK